MTPARSFAHALCLTTALAATTAPLQAEGRSIIVLDGSGSMWGQIDGRPKLEIAREALSGVLAGLPPETELGLMAYGHREKGSCSDIELVVPPAANTAQSIADAANAMKFLGKTPLSEAVRQAAQELRATEEKATVILITDGIETCDADPCALGTELEQAGVDFTTHVVGFGLTEDEGKAVACLAENTGGRYIQAGDAGTLVEALKTTVAAAPAPDPAPEPEPAPAAIEFNLLPTATFAAEGDPVPADLGMAWEVYRINADGTTGEWLRTEYGAAKFMLDPGTYRLVGALSEARGEMDVTVTADATLQPVMNLNAGRLIVHPKLDAAAPVVDGAAVQFALPGDRTATYYGRAEVIVPAGDVPVTVTIDQAIVTEVITLAPGATIERDIIAAAGIATIDAFYTAGMKIESGGHAVMVLPAKAALDGTRDTIETNFGPGVQVTLPPGDYLARVELDLARAEAPFTVTGGQSSDVSVVLEAGVMAITAPGATQVDVLSGKADLAGNRERLYTGFDAETTLTAGAGDYLVTVYRGDAATEAKVTVRAGERSEITVP